MKQSLQVNFRITEEIREVFDEIERTTGQKDYAIARTLFHALVIHWRRHKKITLPIQLVADEKSGNEGAPRT